MKYDSRFKPPVDRWQSPAKGRLNDESAKEKPSLRMYVIALAFLLHIAICDWGTPRAHGQVPAAPLADDRFDVNGLIKPCRTDQDCQLGETGPDPQTVCRDSDGDGLHDSCYVARSRYLSIKISQNPDNQQTAVRVSLDTVTAGNVPLGFVSTPEPRTVEGPGPNDFLLTRIQSEPVYVDWDEIDDKTGGYMSIADCEVSPGQTYHIQAIAEGDNIDIESNYSLPLRIPTSRFYGDVTGSGNPGDPPNGTSANISDAFAMMKGFQNTQVEPKDWLDTAPSIGAAQPNLVINLADALEGILAFQLNPYPGPQPFDCPE